jgi:hypothetical protein
MYAFFKDDVHGTDGVYGYLPTNRKPGPANIEVEAVISLPLTDPSRTELLYGVLNIASLHTSAQIRLLYEQLKISPDDGLYSSINTSVYGQFTAKADPH